MKKKIWKHFPSNLSDWIEYTNHILTFVFLKDCMMSSRLCSSLSKREIWPSITWSCSATPIYKNNKKQTINKQIHTSNNSGTGVSCRWKFFFVGFRNSFSAHLMDAHVVKTGLGDNHEVPRFGDRSQMMIIAISLRARLRIIVSEVYDGQGMMMHQCMSDYDGECFRGSEIMVCVIYGM